MANMINIRRDVDDLFYRYKMHPIQSKIEGKGNGIKTVIPNIADVAHDLGRPPIYITKYFGFELGAQAKVDKSGNVERHIVNGAHDKERLQELLDGFIGKFVLCGECKNPETVVVIIKDHVKRDCKACGKRTDLEPSHKLTSFIIKSPPDGSNPNSTNGKKGGKKSRKGKHNQRQNNDNTNGKEDEEDEAAPVTPTQESDEGDIGMGGGDDDAITKQLNAEAAQLPQEGSSKLGGDNWAVDTSPEAVQARQRALESGMAVVSLNGGVNSTALGEDDEEGEGEESSVFDVLGGWISTSKPSDVEIIKKIKELGVEGRSRVAAVLAQTIFTTSGIVREIPKRAALLTKLMTAVGDEGPSDKSQKALLGGLERFIGLSHPDLLPQTPKILMGFYDEDILTEEVIAKWGSKKGSSRYVDKEVSKRVRKAAGPFLKWLEDAESE